MYSKRTKKLALGLYHTQIRPHEHDIVAIQVSDLTTLGLGTVDAVSDRLVKNRGMVM